MSGARAFFSFLFYENHAEIIYRYISGVTANKIRFELNIGQTERLM
ncbi:hypothetical protein ACFTRD_09235 [Paenibacillus sp. NPDC056933]